jgi:hypothetical protein
MQENRELCTGGAGEPVLKPNRVLSFHTNLQLGLRSTDLTGGRHWTPAGDGACRDSIVHDNFGLADKIGTIAM